MRERDKADVVGMMRALKKKKNEKNKNAIIVVAAAAAAAAVVVVVVAEQAKSPLVRLPRLWFGECAH